MFGPIIAFGKGSGFFRMDGLALDRLRYQTIWSLHELGRSVELFPRIS